MRVMREAVGAGGLTENLKKGVTEMLVLNLLDIRPMTIHEILKLLDERSEGICKITYPYAIIYRLTNSKLIKDHGKEVSDNRLRAYYEITEAGRKHLAQMRSEYTAFTEGVNHMLDTLAEDNKAAESAKKSKKK